MAERIDAIGGTQWLIGLNKKNASGQGVDGTWQWVDGSDPAAGYSNWGSGEPDAADCAIMNGSGVWQDFKASTRGAFAPPLCPALRHPGIARVAPGSGVWR